MFQMIIFALIVGFSFLSIGDIKPQLQTDPNAQPVIVAFPTTGANARGLQGGGKDSLQLETFGYITITPTPPQTYCDRDNVKSNASCTCVDQEEDTVYCQETACQSTNQGSYTWFRPPGVDNSFSCVYGPNDPLHNQKAKQSGCIDTCIGKPVIYLYPLVDTIVNVNVTTPGSIVVSDPLYPSGGWKNVLAHPSGSFDYQGKSYHELFYETSVTKVNQPPTGIIIPQAQLQSKLTDVTTQLGLLPAEQHEFLSYWLPRLHALNTPYILFSLLPPHEKDRVDHVDISPAPDTMIDFIAYFKPLPFPQPILPLQLPNTPPLRNGFTAVEWGGTIEK